MIIVQCFWNQCIFSHNAYLSQALSRALTYIFCLMNNFYWGQGINIKSHCTFFNFLLLLYSFAKAEMKKKMSHLVWAAQTTGDNFSQFKVPTMCFMVRAFLTCSWPCSCYVLIWHFWERERNKKMVSLPFFTRTSILGPYLWDLLWLQLPPNAVTWRLGALTNEFWCRDTIKPTTNSIRNSLLCHFLITAAVLFISYLCWMRM